ncbi:MAG: FecR domain-containing protein [Mangrovibacterium sp.]|nr:FecR domain-containing protein [Mangrovibacterium sp.]
MEKQDIESLLIKLFSGKATPEEGEMIRSWVGESDWNRKEFAAYKKLWDDSTYLVLSDSVDVEKALIHTKDQIPRFSRKTKWILVARQAAAVLLLAVVFSIALNYFLNRNPDREAGSIVYQEIKAAFGTQTKLILADGTNVWLNSGSTLRFPVSFENTQKRQVDLKGEGYFEVAKNSQKPFIVNTCKLQVKALGTSFNVNAYEDEKHIEVALIEGKVELLQPVKGEAVSIMTLQPSEIADYNVEDHQITHKSEPEIERYSAWKEGKIVFFNDPVEKLISRLENWYNVDIEITGNTLKGYHFTATFGQESLDQVLKYLSISTPFSYQFVPMSAADKKEGKKQKIILFGK